MAAPKVDILVNLLTALQPFAGGATTLPLNDADQPLDYSRLIGGIVIDNDLKIQQITSSLNTLYSYYTSLNTTVQTIVANGLTVPDISLLGIMPDSEFYPVEVVITAIGVQFMDLRNATGDPSDLTAAVNYQDKIYEDSGQTLDQQLSLTDPATQLDSLTGWVTSPTVVADSIKNMWITINDMRYVVQTLIAPTIATSCSSISVNYTGVIDTVNQVLRLYFLGNCVIPPGFRDVSSTGGLLIIDDNINPPYNTYVNLTNSLNLATGVVINLQGTGVNSYLPLTTTLTYNITNGSLTCGATLTPIVITPVYNVCVPLTVAALSTTTVQAFFNPVVTNNITYTIQLYNNTGVTYITNSGNFVNPTGPISYIFTGLTTGTTYQVRIRYTFDGSTYYNCSFNSVTTL